MGQEYQAAWVVDELDRDLHALWRFFRFLARTERAGWDHVAASEVIGAYARDPDVCASIAASPYHQIDGLWPVHRGARRRLRRKAAPCLSP